MTQYGSETILPYNKEEQKGTQVKRMFDSIAETYDQLNHTLSFGIDKIWRRKGIAFLRPFSPKTILDIDEEKNVRIDMTLTAPNCPAADFILEDVRMKVEAVDGVNNVEVNLVFEPEWDKDMMTEEAKLELGFL